MKSPSTDIRALLEVMARLRDPDRGCPWDLDQTFETIAPYTIEEAYEVTDAIERRAWDELKDELGDLLLQVVFHARMAEEEQRFDFADVVESIVDKMIRRHPHVFGDERIDDPELQTERWEAHKARENPHHRSVLDGVTVALPAMTRAVKIQKRVARVGFDWPTPQPVFDKIAEELEELRHECERKPADEERIAEEVGDLLFACTNLARHLKVDPERALRGTNRRFEERFRHIEAQLASRNRKPEELSLDELEALWIEAKEQLHKPSA
ncbi:MAG: nucleoside triphosphate pyrophosphohydrolase [Gammaproteobacteria bacterium]